MNKTKIEWVKNPDGTPGYTWNPTSGCLNGCSYCYARRLANGRLKQRYLANANISLEGEYTKEHPEFLSRLKDPFYPRFWPGRLTAPHKIKKPAGIFLDDMSDWMGSYWPEEWTRQELQMMKDNPRHRIYTLTKQPQNLIKWSPFPGNCWVGVTVTDDLSYGRAVKGLAEIEATIKYISFEPLLESPAVVHLTYGEIIKWIIIGAMTGNLEDIKKMLMEYPQLTLMPWGKRWTLQPKIEWVEEIVKVADKAGIPVFLKNNLKPLLKNTPLAKPTRVRYKLDDKVLEADIGGHPWGKQGDYVVDQGNVKRLEILEVLDCDLRQEMPK